MKVSFEQMTEPYINQHYPKRSVFSFIDSSNKKGGIGVYIFFGLTLLLFGALTILGIAMTLMFIKDGENDEITTGLIITGFSLVFCTVSVWMILLTKKRRGTAVLSGQKPGILTRDYIYLADSKNIVMKRYCQCMFGRADFLHECKQQK